MNFSLHIADSLVKSLEGLVKRTGKRRNAVINEALRRYLEEGRRSRWPKAVLDLAGACRNLEPFEKSRRNMKEVSRDPLA